VDQGLFLHILRIGSDDLQENLIEMSNFRGKRFFGTLRSAVKSTFIGQDAKWAFLKKISGLNGNHAMVEKLKVFETLYTKDFHVDTRELCLNGGDLMSAVTDVWTDVIKMIDTHKLVNYQSESQNSARGLNKFNEFFLKQIKGFLDGMSHLLG
jgi:hypothetical protein